MAVDRPKRKKPEPTQTTPKGIKIPIPTRKEFLRNLEKVSQPKPASAADDDGPKQ